MSDRLSVEEQLERTEKEVDDLRHALDHSSIVAFTDATGTITYLNDKFCEISKFSREELIGQNHRIINSGHHPKEFFVDLWTTISSGKTWKGEVKNRTKDGSFYWVFTTIVPFMTAKGRPFKYVAIRTDITEQKLVQELAERHRATLIHSEKMASVGELAAGIAHELGNPLATIRGRVEFQEMQIQAGKRSDTDLLKTFDTVKSLCDRMAAIIRGMRALSRDGTNDPFHNTSVARMINDVLGFTWESFKKHGITTHTTGIDASVEILCQETQISQVFVNLINNAKDAILQLDERWIKIEVLDGPENVEIAVSDSGRGIPKELREKIMQPFFTTKDMGEGSGLGLSVSTAIIENHGGSLVIDSSAPNTRFVVRLPKQRKTRSSA
ncbi:MAG: PAS domain S-box protein [Deltaproteobacteria bacterium]|nr:PAS domain S-box protein [Deltaproteobacteria bacterium]